MNKHRHDVIGYRKVRKTYKTYTSDIEVTRCILVIRNDRFYARSLLSACTVWNRLAAKMYYVLTLRISPSS